MKKLKAFCLLWILISICTALVSGVSYITNNSTGTLVLTIAGIWSSLLAFFINAMVSYGGRRN